MSLPPIKASITNPEAIKDFKKTAQPTYLEQITKQVAVIQENDRLVDAATRKRTEAYSALRDLVLTNLSDQNIVPGTIVEFNISKQRLAFHSAIYYFGNIRLSFHKLKPDDTKTGKIETFDMPIGVYPFTRVPDRPRYVNICHGVEIRDVDGSVVECCKRQTQSKIVTHPTVEKPIACVLYNGCKRFVEVRVTERHDKTQALAATYVEQKTCYNAI